MNKKIIISIAVIVLLLLAAGIYVMSGKKSATTDPQINKVQETEQSFPTSLKELLTAGIPQKCTFKDLIDEVNTEGTTYVASGKMRGDFSTTIEGKTTTGHTVYDGTTSYVWMDGNSTGFKMDIDPNETTSSESETQQGLDLNKTIDYNCSAWLPDQSLFTPPDDVTFTAFTMPSGADTVDNQNMCATCDALSGEQKTQCLTALNCN